MEHGCGSRLKEEEPRKTSGRGEQTTASPIVPGITNAHRSRLFVVCVRVVRLCNASTLCINARSEHGGYWALIARTPRCWITSSLCFPQEPPLSQTFGAEESVAEVLQGFKSGLLK